MTYFGGRIFLLPFQSTTSGEGQSLALLHTPDMITCTELNSVLTDKEVFAVGRYKDPKIFPLSAEAVGRILKRHRNPDKVERYQTGGLNIYKASIDGDNGTSQLQAGNFLFSIPITLVERYLPKTCGYFNFPGRPATVP